MTTENQTVLKVLNHLNSKIGTGGVVDSWSDGQGNFWRKYADGFIEQGGEFPGSTSHSDNTITLNKEFTNLGYQVFVQPTWFGNDGLGSRVWKKTLTSFTAVFASVDDPHAMWFACGY